MSFIMTCMATILWDLLIYNDRLDNPASTARMHRNTVTQCNTYMFSYSADEVVTFAHVVLTPNQSACHIPIIFACLVQEKQITVL